VPQSEVTFDIDANGILSVSAKDKATGREQRITITASSGLSKDEIEKMAREAELHAEEDRRVREEIETKNNADSLAYNAEKIIREDDGKLPSDLKDEVQEKVNGVRAALEKNDTTEIRSATEELSQAMQRLGSAVYGQGQGGQGQGGQGHGGQGQGGPSASGPGNAPPRKNDEGTVEGEFREV
jgi:molecular chaperone DnaK